MKVEESVVTSKKKPVGKAQYEVYDSVSEAVEHQGEERILNLINTQHATNAKNEVRAQAGPPSKSKLQKKAMASITPEEFASCAGDEIALQNLIDTKAEELKNQILAERAALAEDDSEDSDEDED